MDAAEKKRKREWEMGLSDEREELKKAKRRKSGKRRSDLGESSDGAVGVRKGGKEGEGKSSEKDSTGEVEGDTPEVIGKYKV
jgi:hypothetical protein